MALPYINLPQWKLREPWTKPNWLSKATPITSSLLVVTNTLIFVLSIINAATVNLPSSAPDAKYLDSHALLISAQLVFFWCTIPLTYFITAATEAWYLWTDRLRPLYVVGAAPIAIGIWILQIVLWGSCVFTMDPEKAAMPGYCPYIFHSSMEGDFHVQRVGEPGMVVYLIPLLFILYIIYLACGITAMRHENKLPQTHQLTSFIKRHTFTSSHSDLESQKAPPAIRWSQSSNSPPVLTDSPSSYDNTVDHHDSSVDSDGIALLITTPYGTTRQEEERNPFNEVPLTPADQLKNT